MIIINLKYKCKSCGKDVDKLRDGHCPECINHFKEQWQVSYGESANKTLDSDGKKQPQASGDAKSLYT